MLLNPTGNWKWSQRASYKWTVKRPDCWNRTNWLRCGSCPAGTPWCSTTTSLLITAIGHSMRRMPTTRRRSKYFKTWEQMWSSVHSKVWFRKLYALPLGNEQLYLQNVVLGLVPNNWFLQFANLSFFCFLAFKRKLICLSRFQGVFISWKKCVFVIVNKSTRNTIFSIAIGLHPQYTLLWFVSFQRRLQTTMALLLLTYIVLHAY